MTRTITMRSTDRDTAGDSRLLWASLDEAGDLVIHGQDLGPFVGVLGGGLVRVVSDARKSRHPLAARRAWSVRKCERT